MVNSTDKIFNEGTKGKCRCDLYKTKLIVLQPNLPCHVPRNVCLLPKSVFIGLQVGCVSSISVRASASYSLGPGFDSQWKLYGDYVFVTHIP